jgi:hypothetical protein
MPLILMIMLMIFLLFESFPNALAELTLFADREFYQDWWNATSVEEFYGKWLKPQYLFYYRHVLVPLQRSKRMSPAVARAMTNLVSSAMQEVIMVRYSTLILALDNELPSIWAARIQGLNNRYHMDLHTEQISPL